MKEFYRRRLPHIQPAEASYFITYRLAGSLPRQALTKLQEKYNREKKNIKSTFKDDKLALAAELKNLQQYYFYKYEYYLDQVLHGPAWLGQSAVAQVVSDSLHFLEQQLQCWELWAFSILSNHVHIVCTLLPDAPPVHEIMRRHKNFTAVHCNRILGRTGEFWQEESFDRLIRDEDDFYFKIWYTLNNPVKASLVKNWQDWPFNFCHPEIRKQIE